jgi:hypothetical protein
MKIEIILVATAGALILTMGCSKNEDMSSPPAPPVASETPAREAQKAVTTAETQAEAVKDKVADAAAGTQAQVDAAGSKIGDLIEQARKYLAENKPSDALTVLNQLVGQKLTPEQQSLVQSLKEQAQKAVQAALKSNVTDEAAKAAGGLLKK